MPLHTIVIVGGTWLILLGLTIWNYRRRARRNGDE
jgi:hypothetical protein